MKKSKELLLIALATFGGTALQFVAQAMVARHVSLNEYGKFSSALSLVNVCSVIAGMGAPAYLIQRFGQYGITANKLVSALISIVRGLGLCSTAICAAIAIFLTSASGNAAAIALMAPSIFCSVLVEVLIAKSRIEGSTHKLFVLQMAVPIGRALATAIGVLASVGALTYSAAYGVVALLLSSLLLPAVSRMQKRGVSPQVWHEQPGLPDAIGFRYVVTDAWPFAVNVVLYSAYFQSTAIVLPFVESYEEVGRYFSCLTILGGIFIIPDVIFQRFLGPKLAGWRYVDPGKFRKMWLSSLSVVMFGGVALAALVFLGSETILTTLYGERFKPIAMMLSLMALSIPMRCGSNAISCAMVSRELVKTKALVMAVVVALMLVGTLTVVPHIGEGGAAYIFIASESLIFLGYLSAFFSDQPLRSILFK